MSDGSTPEVATAGRAGGTAFHTRGAGDTVVLLHGLGMHRDFWAPQIEGLARDHRVVACDLLGHGDSALPAVGVGLVNCGEGFYYRPTILACCNASVPSVMEELFRPVESVLTFTDEDEAVARASGTRYALAAGDLNRDLARAHRLARRIRAAIVWVNTYRAVSPLVPFGLSGMGREGGRRPMLDYTCTNSVWIRTSYAPIGDPFVMY